MAKEWLWVDAPTAAMLAETKDVHMEALRNGYSFLDVSAFARKLLDSSFKVIIFKNRTAALVEFVDTKDGLLLNILTVTGNIETCDESIKWLEAAARELKVDVIVSVGHMGWLHIMRKNGYYTERKLLMRKYLNDQATESRSGDSNGAGTAEVLHVG